MRKTFIIYAVLMMALFVRLYKVCEGDLSTCGGAGEVTGEKSRIAEIPFIKKFRANMVLISRKHLPSPHSELVLGMTVGIDKFYEVPKFKKMLRDTGTIHVVVVSGYNVTLVYSTIIRLLGTPYKSRNIIIALAGTLFFAVVSGFEPPVVRAWVMGSIIAVGKYYGRRISAMKVLLFTGLALILANPKYVYSLSFQLSFLATLSLIMFESGVSDKIKKIFKTKSIFVEDLSATVSAQILIWPFLSYKFGKISLISLVVNALVLWTVPLSTMMGAVFLALGSLSGVLGAFLSVLVYLPLDFFVVFVEFFSKFRIFMLDKEVSLVFLLLYYFFLGVMYLMRTRLEAERGTDGPAEDRSEPNSRLKGGLA